MSYRQSDNLADCLIVSMPMGLLYNFSSGILDSSLLLAANEHFLTKEEMIASYWESQSGIKTDGALLIQKLYEESKMFVWEFFGGRQEVLTYLKDNGTSDMIYKILLEQTLTGMETLELLMHRVHSTVFSINYLDAPPVGKHHMEAVQDAMEFIRESVGKIESYLDEYAEESDHP